MKNNFSKLLALTCMTCVLLTACIKNDYTALTNQGKTMIKFMQAPENAQFFSVFNDVKKVNLFSIRREANSAAELNTATTIKLTTSAAAIDKYNTDHGTNFEVLPDSLFTIANPDFVRSGNDYTVTFKPGEFAKEFDINMNGAKWDVSHTYALAFAVSDFGGKVASVGLDTMIAFLSIKNKYDGKYTVTGTLVDYVSSALTGNYPWNVELRTSGPNSVIVYDVQYNMILHPISNNGSWSYYGGFGVEITFDPATDKVVSVTSPLPLANTRTAGLDPSGINQWNPTTKNLDIKYFMYQPNAVATAPHIRVSFDENFKYVGPR